MSLKRKKLFLMLSIFIVITVVLIFFFKKSPEPVPVSVPQQLNEEVLHQKRIAVGKEYFDGINLVFKLLGADEKLQTLRNSISKITVGVPKVRDGLTFVGLDHAPEKGELVMAPFLNIEKERLGAWNFFLKDNCFASYKQEAKAVLVREAPEISLLWKGIIFAHECKHYESTSASKLDAKNDTVLAKEEVAAHSFQHHLMAKIGGDCYRRALDREKSKIQPLAKKGDFVFKVGDYDDDLDCAFGVALSQRERLARQLNLWINACLESIQDNNGKEGNSLKILFMGNFYKSLKNI